MNDIENPSNPNANLLNNNNDEGEGEASNNQEEQPTASEFIQELNFSPRMNSIALFISISKVIASSLVLSTTPQCFNPFQVWIILMLGHDGISLLTRVYYTIAIFRANRITNSEPILNENGAPENYDSLQREVNENLERRRTIRGLTKTIKSCISFSASLNIFYFCLFFSANILYFIFQNRSCPNESEDNLLLAYLIIGHLWFLGPLTFFILLGIASPLITLILYCIRRSREQLRSQIMKKLKPQKFSNNLPGNHECSICILEYEPNDDIIQLKCSPMHHFHEDCIKPWLKVNGKCPLCRVSLTDMYNS